MKKLTVWLIVLVGIACILLTANLIMFAKPGPPRVVSMTPANGAANVDPNLTEIRVVFDRPMTDRSWSMCGGGDNFPPGAGRPHYDAKHTTWSVPVALKPGMTYEFGLNSPSYQNFKSAKGIPLKPVWVKFTTATAQ